MKEVAKHEQISPLQRFWRLLQPDSREIRNVYVYAIFNGLVSLSLPLGIQAIVNLIQGGSVSTSWVVLVSVVVVGVAATGVLQIMQLRITENLQQRIFTRAAFEFAYRVPRIRLEALYKEYAPELMNRFFDIISVQKGLAKILLDFSVASLQVVFGLILLSFYHPFFILFSLMLVLLVYVIFRLTARKGLDASLKESKHKYRVAHWLEELARTSTTFKLAGRTGLPLRRTDEIVDDYLIARENHFKILLTQYSLLVIFKVVVATGLLAIGGILVMEQVMNIGQFIAAEIIILLVLRSVEKLILSLETIYDVLTALEKIAQVTDMELEAQEGIDICAHSNKEGIALSVKDVSFSYPEAADLVLKNVSLEVSAGEKVVIVGKNDSGKSTLLQLLAGMYEADSGHINYEGLPVGNLDLTSLRSIIGDSLNQEDLFQGTLLDNIAMGRSAATFENVQWSVQAMGLEGFVQKLPKGYNTVIDPQGKKLSRSVFQKILLARSIADKPKLLLLEDSMQYIDPEERDCIINFLMDPSNAWTLVVVSADMGIAKKANKIYEMNAGVLQLQK